MTKNAEDLEQFLQTLSGSDTQPSLLVRADSPLGWREWTIDDDAAFLEWAHSGAQDGSAELKCLNQREVAELLGVSVPTVTQWLRRERDPIPHLKNGRTVRVPLFLLKEWLRDESARSLGER